MGILICGLNGAGKSTLGRMLAERLSCPFIDSEELFFSETEGYSTFSHRRSRQDVIRMIEERIKMDHRFVFAAVTGDYGDAFLSSVDQVVLMEAPREIRLRRVYERSLRRFGARMLPGGDLHDQERGWFCRVESRPEDHVRTWLRNVRCPVIRVDGTLPPEQNLNEILSDLAGRTEILQK